VTTCTPLPFVGAKVGMSAASFRGMPSEAEPGGAQDRGVFIRHIWGGYDRRSHPDDGYCVIADNSLLLAFLQKKQMIEREIVEIAAKDRRDNIGSAARPEPSSKKKVNGEAKPKPKAQVKEGAAHG
jgi:hypothetical protein